MSANINEITQHLTMPNASHSGNHISVDVSDTTTCTYLEFNSVDSCINVTTQIGVDSATIEIKRNPTRDETILILNLLGQ